MRTCIGCRRAFPLADDRLVRITATPDGYLAVGRKLPGRGAWLCDDVRCHDRALRLKVLVRALRVGGDGLRPDAVDRFRSHFPAVVADARD